jgi:hypothetical protein
MCLTGKVIYAPLVVWQVVAQAGSLLTPPRRYQIQPPQSGCCRHFAAQVAVLVSAAP